MNVYSLLIPIEDSKLFLLINTKSFLEKFKLPIALKFNDCYSKQFYFFPFAICSCKNHIENPECLKNICHDMKLLIENIVGYIYISNRTIDKSSSYIFYVLLLKSVKLSELNLDDLEYCLYPFKCNDNYLLLGPEVQSVIKYQKTCVDKCSNDILSIRNALPFDNYCSVTFKSILENTNQSDWMQKILKKTCLTIQEEVYRTYMKYSYPCSKMAYPQFLQFMLDQKIDKTEIFTYFRCFDVASDGFISFYQFLIAVGCMDSNTIHGGQVGELRSRYIFSFYDEDKDGFLTTFDIKKMIIDINKKKNKSIDDKSVDEILNDAIRVFDINVNNLKVNEDVFLTVVGNLLFRGTSVLFRFPPDVSFSKRMEKNTQEYYDMDKNILINKEKVSSDYVLAVHSIKVHKEGTVAMVRPIWEDIKSIDQESEFGDKFNLTFNRLHSINTFNKESCPNEILQALKYFSCADELNKKPRLDWGDINMTDLAKYLNILCDDVIKIVSEEPRLLELQSPAYVLGDLHGNYSDLIKFEDTLWRLGIGLSPGNFLFLGDYVDRGKYGIEVIANLFAQKILNPTQFFLLRGNHEIRTIQEQFTFKNECILKFGLECGTLVWNNINLAFDSLPLAAVIDNKLFCVHGGIPRPSLVTNKHSESDPVYSLKFSINSITVPLLDPELQSPLAWELMWSDPDRSSNDRNGNNSESVLAPDDIGFKLNNRRRTACCFNQSALEGFLYKYHFSHVIRAHEVQKIGFNIELDAKLITVFSSSHYCNNANEAACVFVNHRKLRLIRLDTLDCS